MRYTFVLAGNLICFTEANRLKNLFWSRFTTIRQYAVMPGKGKFHGELFSMNISHIPPAYFAESIQGLGFYVGGELWRPVCFLKEFFSGVCWTLRNEASFVHRFQIRSVETEGKAIVLVVRVTIDCEISWTMRRTGKANVLTALIDRETNCRGTHDHNLLTSYAEDASVMSCNQTKVRTI